MHLDFVKAGEDVEFCARIVRAACDALVITGDIAEGTSVAGYLQTLATRLPMPIYFVWHLSKPPLGFSSHRCSSSSLTL